MITSNAVAPTPHSPNAILAFQHERLLERYAIDRSEPLDVAAARFNGFKQFMIVCSSMPGRKIASDEIDSIWHTFLLFSRDYRQFCIEHLGRLVDHEPFETPTPEKYLETRRFAEQMFGELDPAVWPLTAKGDCTSGCEG